MRAAGTGRYYGRAEALTVRRASSACRGRTHSLFGYSLSRERGIVAESTIRHDEESVGIDRHPAATSCS